MDNKQLFPSHDRWDGSKYQIIEKDSLEAVDEIPDESLDFIFFDAMMTDDQTFQEAIAYYPKIKKGGYFMGDDAFCTKQVIDPIIEVMNHYGNKNKLTVYNRVFFFRKWKKVEKKIVFFLPKLR